MPQKVTTVVLNRFIRSMLVILACTGVSAQVKPPTPPAKGSPPTKSGASSPSKPPSQCPDKDSEKACKSYEELVKAGDEGVKTTASAGGVALVCFRQPDDEFFVLELNAPLVWTKNHFDSAKKAMVPDDDATSRAFGSVRAFDKGIQNNSLMPLSSFLGDWQYPNYGQPSFEATKVNRADVNEQSNVFVDPIQIEALVRYKNRLDKNVDYHLLIQRSTGRFAESFTTESEKSPFLESQGRCVKLRLK